MPDLLFADFARPLLVVHALSAIVLLGSSLHLAVLGVLLLKRGRCPTKLMRVHVRVTTTAFAITFALGLVIYPTFRILVRGVILDRDAPWATNLFDFKEALLLVALPIVIALFSGARNFELPRDAQSSTFVGELGVALGAIVLVVAVIGLTVTSVRGPV